MSTKAMAKKYSGANVANRAAGGGGILPALGSLFGADKLEGGLVQNADGTWSYTPPTVKHPGADRWLMGGRGSQQAAELRSAIEPPMYVMQEQAKRQEEMARIQAQLQAMQARADFARKEQERVANAKDATDLAYNQQLAIAIAKANMFPTSPESARLIGTTLNPQRLANTAVQDVQIGQDLNDPQLNESARLGRIATNFAPVIANRNASSISVAPNENRYVAPMTPMQTGNMADYSQFTGSMPRQELHTDYDMMGQPKSSRATTNYDPATYRPPQSLIEQAGKIAPGGVDVDIDATDNAADAQKMLEFFKRYVSGKLIR